MKMSVPVPDGPDKSKFLDEVQRPIEGCADDPASIVVPFDRNEP